MASLSKRAGRVLRQELRRTAVSSVPASNVIRVVSMMRNVSDGALLPSLFELMSSC